MADEPTPPYNVIRDLPGVGPTDTCVLYVFRCAHYAINATDPQPELLNWWAWKNVEKHAD